MSGIISDNTGRGTGLIKAAAGGNLIKLGATTVSSSTAYIDLTTVFSSTYKYYKLFANDIEFNTSTYMEVSFLVGGTVQTGTYNGKHVAIIGTDSTSSGQDDDQSATSGFRPIGGWVHSTGQDVNCSMELTFFDPNNNGTYNIMTWSANVRQSSGSNTAIYMFGQGHYAASIAATGVRVAATSGNTLEAGTFSLYGIKE